MFSFVCIAPHVAFVNASLRLLSKLGKKKYGKKINALDLQGSVIPYQCAALHVSADQLAACKSAERNNQHNALGHELVINFTQGCDKK